MDDEAYARLVGHVTALQVAISSLLNASTPEVRDRVHAELRDVALRCEQSGGAYSSGMGQAALDIVKSAFRK